ncbi:MAG: hypothetical protein J6J37_06410 [Bacteroidaceae bacterium]|nr:hypothetical protein [Bacteroidaceae bacterium]
MRNILRNFRITLRSYPLVVALNICGLGVAMAVAYMILVMVHHELSYNCSIKNHENISAVYIEKQRGDYLTGGRLPYGMYEYLRVSMPMVRQAAIIDMTGVNAKSRIEATDDPLDLKRSAITYSALEMFGFEIVDGNFEELRAARTVAVSDEIASRYNLSIGSHICFNEWYWIDEAPPFVPEKAWTVVAIYRDFPSNSDLGKLDIVHLLNGKGEEINFLDWNYSVFITLNDGCSPDEFEVVARKAFEDFLAKHDIQAGNIKRFEAVPLGELYFSMSQLEFPPSISSGNVALTYTLLSVAIALLSVGFINYLIFINSIAPRRLRSVNTQKIMGAGIAGLRLGFVIESVLMILGALFVAYVVVRMFEASEFASMFLTDVTPGKHPGIVALFVLLSIIAAAGLSLWPSYYVTSFAPAFALKGRVMQTKRGAVWRTLLLGLQMVVSCVLIIVSSFIYVQIYSIKNADMGFDRKNLLFVELGEKYPLGSASACDELAAKLRTVDGVVDVAFSDNDVVALGVWVKRTEIKGEQPDGAERVISLRPTFVSRNFLDVMGIPMVESEQNTDAVPYAIILNKAAKERYKITCDNVIPINATEWNIVGFCDDFVSRPMNSDDRTAMGFCFSDSGMNKLFIRIKSDCNVELLVPMIKEVIASYDSNTKADDIVVELYDEKLKGFYKKEEKSAYQVLVFTLVACLVALIGLFASVLFEVRYMEREIALRRVNGAYVADILRLVSIRYLRIVSVAYLLAVPVATYFVVEWLQGFAYKTPLYLWVYLLAFASIALLTVVIVVSSAWRTANYNPVEVLNKD